MATHSSILAWRIPWKERILVGYSPWDCKESDTTERLTLSQISRIEEQAARKTSGPLHFFLFFPFSAITVFLVVSDAQRGNQCCGANKGVLF